MNVQEYIDSGVLYDYCMDSLSPPERERVEAVCARYPQVKAELVQLQKSLEKFAEQTATWPRIEVKETIWDTLENINKEKAGDLKDLPVINKYSDYKNWKRIVAPFTPADLKSDRVVKVIRDYGGVKQMLVISKTDVEEETHENERESFIVLEGECECYIGSNVIRLGPGGFVEIPMHIPHSVKVLSPHVVAVLQHVAL